jgi:hypothetical protein
MTKFKNIFYWMMVITAALSLIFNLFSHNYIISGWIFSTLVWIGVAWLNEKKVMNKVNEVPKFDPSQNNPPHISDDFQIGPDGAYEYNETIKVQQDLINVLESQLIDLSMMSKIELGDDVIVEIKRLKQLINE